MSKPIGRTFYFERELWERLDEDAKRCLRSSTKQMEAILKTYFATERVDLSEAGVELLGELAAHSKQKMPLLKATAAVEPAAEKPKRKKSA